MPYPNPHAAGKRLAACFLVLVASQAAAAETAPPSPDNVRALAELPLDALLDMEVTGASRFAQRRSQSASSVTVVTAADIRAFGWRTLAEALTSVKGLMVASDHTYSYLGVRGFFAQGDYNTRVLLLIDGNRVNENVYDMAFLGTEFPLDLELVDRIEFIPGQGSAVYGANAVFGVVNVITREASRTGLEASLSSGTGRHHIVRVGGTHRMGDGSLIVSASRTRARGPAIYLAERDNPPDSDGVARNDFERRESLYLAGDHGPWRTSLVHADRKKGVPTYVGFAFNDSRSYFRDAESLLDLRWEDEVAPRTSGHVRWFMGHYDFTGEYATDYTPVINREEAIGQWWGLDARLLSAYWRGHTLVAGVEFQKSTRQGVKSFDLDEARTTYWDLMNRSTRTSLYAEDQAALGDALTLTIGARFDHIDGASHEWNPRFALNWRPQPQLVVKAIHGSAYRMANRAETVSTIGKLRSETVRGSELALEWQPGSRSRLSLSWYRNTANHLITGGLDTASGIWYYRNIGQLKASGQELEYEQRFVSGATLRANTTLQRARDSGELPIAQYAPHRIANVLLAMPLGGPWTAGIDVNAASRRGQAAGYGVLNLTLSQRLGTPGVSFSAGVRDVFDRRPDDPGNDPVAQPRIAQVGRAWTARMDIRY